MLQIELQNCKIGIEVSKLEFHFVQYKYFHCLTKLLNWSGNRYSTLKVLVEAVKNCIWPTICPDGHYYPALMDIIILPWRILLSCPDGHYYPALTDTIILPWRTLLSCPDGHYYYPALTDTIILPWRTLLSVKKWEILRFQGNGAQPLSAIFQYIMAVSFIGAGDQSTWRKPPTCRKSLTNFIT